MFGLGLKSERRFVELKSGLVLTGSDLFTRSAPGGGEVRDQPIERTCAAPGALDRAIT
jgi:hypothetical protein